ncbi:MAG: TonB-dependent receptor, partial [Gammaproteobacteria bacterium]|nr:TonB-dependent receptor [Gammaproteobacteria bacterium]
VLHSLTENLTITANLSLTERHPNSTELFADGPHVALSRFERGASAQGLPAFDKEQTTNLDVSVKGETERLRWALTGFFSDIRDYIFAAPDGSEEDGFPVFNFRQTDAEFYGFEAEGRVELWDGDQGHVHAHVFSDFVYGEENGSGPYLPRLPPLRYGFGLHFDGGSMAASVRVIRHERQDKIAAGELPTNAYTLVTADFDYHFSGHDLWLFVKGTNLTDEEARQHTSPVKDLLPLPGRGFQAGLRYEF